MFPKEKPLDKRDQHWGALMKAGQEGDQDALRTLYREISPIILAFCRRRAAYLDIPEDTLQESLLAIHRNRAVYLPERSFKTWMFSIVRTKLIDQLRSRGRRALREQDDSFVTASSTHAYSNIRGEKAEDALSPESVNDTNEQVVNLQQAIQELSPKYREALLLIKIEGYSVREAAGKIGISESAVKVRTHRAFKMLVKKLERSHE